MAPSRASYDEPVPSPPTPSRGRARRGWSATLALVSLTAATVLGGCTHGISDPPGPSPFASATTSSTATAAPVLLATAVSDLLRRRAAAVVAGDRAAYAATVDDPESAPGRRQLDSYRAARDLHVSRLEVGTPVVDLVEDASGPGQTPTSQRATAEVDVRYRVDDLDRGDRVARLRYDLVRGEGRWAVEAERPVGAGATAPWVAMPGLRVSRGRHAVVAGTVPVARLAEHVAVVDRALPGLKAAWTGAPTHVLVLAPATAPEADALLGRTPTAATAPVAATTEGPTGAAGTATGDRVVLDPSAFGRLTASGRDVVLTHELVHVSVRATVPGRPAGWLSEGYADHIGYARADVPTQRLVQPLVAALRTGHAPRALPGAADLQPAAGDIEVPYLAAWQAVELIAARHGEAALRRLVAAAASTGSQADAEAATDAALVSVLGTTRAELTDAWLTRLGHLATNPG